jgi:hypothetical protein
MVKKVDRRTGNRRLLKLAALLLADAKNKKGIKFDIGTVGRVADSTKEEVPLDCGTTACAMGLAAISGVFKKQGLTARFYPEESNQLWCAWNGRIRDYDRTAISLFGITQDQANYLFSPWSYPFNRRIGAAGEKEVVRRIHRVVEGKPIPEDRIGG